MINVQFLSVLIYMMVAASVLFLSNTLFMSSILLTTLIIKYRSSKGSLLLHGHYHLWKFQVYTVKPYIIEYVLSLI